MDDLISRQAAIDAVREHCEKYHTYPIAEYDVEIILNRLPTVTPSAQPESITCIDCIHYTPLGKDKAWGRCSVHSSPTENQRMCQSCDFCAWAERRTDEQIH